MLHTIVFLGLPFLMGQFPAGSPVTSLGVGKRYVMVNNRPTFLVGQMSNEFTNGRSLEDIENVIGVMMTPFGMNLIKGDFGVIYWGAWNNAVNVRRGLESSFRPHRYPWSRTGGGRTTFGGPRFDLERFDQEYFDRLKSLITLFNRRGLVPVVGIFSEHALDHPLHWRGHPFHPENNINRLGLPTRDAIPEFFENSLSLKYQRAYVSKLIETLREDHFILSPFGEVNRAPTAYIDKWLRFFEKWECETGRELLLCISGRSEVLDIFASDPAVDLIDVYCYHGGRYNLPEVNVPDGKLGIRATIEQAWTKYQKPVGKLYHKYGYPYADSESPWADPVTGTEGGGPKTAARDALRAVYECGGFGCFFKMAWARDRGAYLQPDSWSEDIREFWKSVSGSKARVKRKSSE